MSFSAMCVCVCVCVRACVLVCVRACVQGAGIAQLVGRLTEKPGITDAGSSPRYGKGFFS